MSTTNKARDRGPDGRLLRKYRRCDCSPCFPCGTPKWWRKLFMTRPRRRENKRVCWLILHGLTPTGSRHRLAIASRTCTTGEDRQQFGAVGIQKDLKPWFVKSRGNKALKAGPASLALS
jgi:hypothetical protein